MVKNMNSSKSECWGWKLGLIPVMCSLVGLMVYIGYLGETQYNWNIETSTTRTVLLCLISFIGYTYVVIKDEVLALAMIAVQFFALLVMMISQFIYGCFIVDTFSLSKAIFENILAFLILAYGLGVLHVVIVNSRRPA